LPRVRVRPPFDVEEIRSGIIGLGAALARIFVLISPQLPPELDDIMSIGTNVILILKTLQNLTGTSQRTEGIINAGFAALYGRLDELESSVDDIKTQLGQPETGHFNPNPQDPSMSVLQMTVGDPPHSGKLTFSEPTAPSDGAVTSDNPAVATMSLDLNDHVSWTINLATPPLPGIATFAYTGTSVAPDAGPAVVEPLVLTVVPVPVAETGQFNP
jgi:hypothetical protein